MPSDVIKIKARDELIRVTEDEIGQKFSSLSQNQQSISATKFYVREIHNPLRNNISEDDIIDSVVDGKNDLGCDFIYRDDGHVLIIQSKFRGIITLT